MATVTGLTEADILDDLIAPQESGLHPEAARFILGLGFKPSARNRLKRLLAKNNTGTLTDDERQILDNYLRVGQLLDLMQAKARLSLKSKRRSN